MKLHRILFGIFILTILGCSKDNDPASLVKKSIKSSPDESKQGIFLESRDDSNEFYDVEAYKTSYSDLNLVSIQDDQFIFSYLDDNKFFIFTLLRNGRIKKLKNTYDKISTGVDFYLLRKKENKVWSLFSDQRDVCQIEKDIDFENLKQVNYFSIKPSYSIRTMFEKKIEGTNTYYNRDNGIENYHIAKNCRVGVENVLEYKEGVNENFWHNSYYTAYFKDKAIDGGPRWNYKLMINGSDMTDRLIKQFSLDPSYYLVHGFFIGEHKKNIFMELHFVKEGKRGYFVKVVKYNGDEFIDTGIKIEQPHSYPVNYSYTHANLLRGEKNGNIFFIVKGKKLNISEKLGSIPHSFNSKEVIVDLQFITYGEKLNKIVKKVSLTEKFLDNVSSDNLSRLSSLKKLGENDFINGSYFEDFITLENHIFNTQNGLYVGNTYRTLTGPYVKYLKEGQNGGTLIYFGNVSTNYFDLDLKNNTVDFFPVSVRHQNYFRNETEKMGLEPLIFSKHNKIVSIENYSSLKIFRLYFASEINIDLGFDAHTIKKIDEDSIIVVGKDEFKVIKLK